MSYNNNGYVQEYDPTHILANANGTIMAHRKVLFGKIGFGPHRCSMCGIHINWRAGLEADHIDGNRANNDPENLRALCVSCNRSRRLFRTHIGICAQCGTEMRYVAKHRRYCAGACKSAAYRDRLAEAA